MEHIPLMIRIR